MTRTDSLPELILPLIAGVSRAMKARVERALSAHSLHAGQEFVLQRLWQEDGLSPGELAERIGVETPTVTRTVQRMEAAGLVVRRPDPSDARVVRVYLTSRGRELEGVVPPLLKEVAEEALHGLSVTERETLVRLLARLLANIGPARG